MSSPTAPFIWELEIAGLRHPISESAVVIGRDPDCDITLMDTRVSWQHLRIELRAGVPHLTDLGSSNGTYVDGVMIDEAGHNVTRESILLIGNTRARLRESMPGPSANQGRFRRLPVRQQVIRIGRAPSNDVVLDEPNVS